MNNIYHTPNYTEFTHLELFLEEILGIKENGSFIEIGAFDGDTNSKTARLADIGWSGIYVEPVNEYYLKCKKRHATNDVKVINAAIADSDGTQKMYKGGLPSTLKADHKSHINAYTKEKKNELKFEEEEINVVSWNTFISDYNVQQPDVLVVDAEGHDLTIIESIDFETFKPSIIFCEVFPEDTPFIHPTSIHEGQKIVSYLKTKGYYIWLQEEHNILFSTKKPPLTIDDISACSDTSYFRKLNDNSVKPTKELSFLRQLLKTAILRKDDDSIRLFATLLANHIDGSVESDTSLLALAFFKLKQYKQSLSFINLSLKSAEVKVNSSLELIKYECLVHLDRIEEGEVSINKLIEADPFDLRLSALRVLNKKRVKG